MNCHMCQEIPIRIFFELPEKDSKTLVVHHPSFKSLESSALSGCNICNLIHRTISEGHARGQDYCYESRDQDELLRVDSHNHRTYLGLRRHTYNEVGISPVYMVYKVSRNRILRTIFWFDLEYSGTTFRPLGQSAILTVQTWLKTCTDTHGKCNERYDLAFKPTRLLDVGSRGVSPRLVETAGIESQSWKYLALSYCWGTTMSEAAKTKTATLPQRLKQIRIQTLPKTFRDAVAFTRRHSIRYIWIDSLCIIQDSRQDWQYESALMGKIYSHCFCTIAAAASSDSDGGLFMKRSDIPMFGSGKSSQSLSSVIIKQKYDGWDELFSESSLNQRCWTLQERELSPRILYFTKHTMLFECREARGGECGESRGQSLLRSPAEELVPKRLLKSDSFHRCMDQLPLEDTNTDSFHWRTQKRYQMWREMVQGYSRRKLSVATDKFPGLSGLASEVAYLLNDEYVAGLWKGDLIRGLSWCFKRSEVHAVAQCFDYGPSWSWAKMIVPITYEFTERRDAARNLNVGFVQEWKEPLLIHTKTIPTGVDPNGTLMAASIHFEGQVIPMQRSKTGNCIIQGESIQIIWDFLPQSASSFFLFSLGSIGMGLVLVADGQRERTYQRVGLVTSIEYKWFEDFQLQSITLT